MSVKHKLRLWGRGATWTPPPRVPLAANSEDWTFPQRSTSALNEQKLFDYTPCCCWNTRTHWAHVGPGNASSSAMALSLTCQFAKRVQNRFFVPFESVRFPLLPA